MVAYRRLEPEIRQLLAEGHTVRMIFDMKEAQLPVSYRQFVKLVRQYADKPPCAVPPSASAVLVSTAEPSSLAVRERTGQITGIIGKRREDRISGRKSS